MLYEVDGEDPELEVSWDYRNDLKMTDGKAAWAKMDDEHYRTSHMRLTGLGFQIPTGATIKGVVVDMKREASHSKKTYDNGVSLVFDGTEIGDDLSTINPWPTSYAGARFGGEDALWGATLDAATVNDATFGVIFGVYTTYHDWGYTYARVDSVSVTVHYCK